MNFEETSMSRKKCKKRLAKIAKWVPGRIPEEKKLLFAQIWAEAVIDASGTRLSQNMWPGGSECSFLKTLASVLDGRKLEPLLKKFAREVAKRVENRAKGLKLPCKMRIIKIGGYFIAVKKKALLNGKAFFSTF